MEQVNNIIDSSLNISSLNIFGTSHSKLLKYKIPDINFSNQDVRRRKVLEEQKRRRDEVLAKFRGLFEDKHLFEESDKGAMEWTEEKKEKKKKPRKKVDVMKQLMFSEWLLDIPCDFEKEWLVKPCPVGQRVLLITQGGKVLFYSKRGLMQKSSNFNVFNVNKKSYTDFGYIILDCIYNNKNDTHYVLDVLNWKFPMLSSTAEFRFYWLDYKFKEIFKKSGGAKIELLPYYSASQLTELMETYPIFPDNVPELDGLLLYHKLGFYEPGITPLVGWIKPFMLPKMLNIPVNQQYSNEIGCDEIIQLIQEENKHYYGKSKYKSKKKKKSPGKGEQNEEMETEVDSAVSACADISIVEEVTQFVP